MDNFGDWHFRRDFHITLGGSGTIAFARQQIYDRVEHFESTVTALERIECHNPHRPVRLEIQLEVYFLSIFACLEQITISTCNDVADISRLTICYDDIRGSSVFERAIKYLQLVEIDKTVDKEVLTTLAKYHIVRNAVAHGVGMGNIAGSKLKTISQLEGVFVDSKTKAASITKLFCERFNDFSYKYIGELEKVTAAYGDRLRKKVGSVA